ncbi:hypothetical protein ACTA71_006006 [Dictyostelium dimigraforme]
MNIEKEYLTAEIENQFDSNIKTMNIEKEYLAEIENQIDSNIKIIDSIFSTIHSTFGLHREIANSLVQATETNIIPLVPMPLVPMPLVPIPLVPMPLVPMPLVPMPLVPMEQNCSTPKKIEDVEMKSNTEESSSLISISDEGILEYNNNWPILFPLAQQC